LYDILVYAVCVLGLKQANFIIPAATKIAKQKKGLETKLTDQMPR